MNDEKLNVISKDICCATSDWIKNYPTGGKFDTLKPTFEPLLKGLLEECVWIVTGVKTGASKLFIPEMNSEYSAKYFISTLIQKFANHNKAISTIDFCLDLTSSSKGLAIISKNEWFNNDCNQFLYVSVEKLVNSIKSDLEFYFRIINMELKSKDEPTSKELDQLSDILLKSLISRPRAEIFDNHSFSSNKADDITAVRFSLYILLVTLIDPDWAKVIMLPTYTTANHLHQPGGVVLCLKKFDAIDNVTLDLVRKIASIPFLPWMLTARTTNRSDKQHLKPKIVDYKPGINNNYRNIEYLMGGERYTLTNKKHFKCFAEFPDISTQITGFKYFCEVINKYKPNSLTYVEDDGNGNKNIITSNLEISEIIDSLMTRKEKLLTFEDCDNETKKKNFKYYEEYKLWLKERKQRIANIEDSIIDGVCNSISIIVPIASDDKRFENFFNVLSSYDQQSAIAEHPRLFELIILIDSNENTNEYRKSKACKLKKLIQSLNNLKKINIRILYSKKSGGSIGRSSIRNHGISLAKGTIIQLFDDSILLHKYYLEEILIRFEHLRGQKFAIVGFKERVTTEKELQKAILSLMNEKELILPDVRDDFKCKEKFHLQINYLYENIPEGKEFSYMKLTNDLCFITGKCKIGNREVNHFFSTSNVAFWKKDFIDSGGFHPRFDKDWGMEDGFLGLLLTVNGTKIIPCYSALAFDLPHIKDKTKKDMKEDGAVPYNLDVLNDLNSKNLSYYNAGLFEKNVEDRASHFIELI